MKIVTFGEIMLRLSPQGTKRLFQGPLFESTFCGAEANVAVALSEFGKDAGFVTRLPDNEPGKAVIAELRRHGVDTSGIVFGGERLGILFAEKGASQRPSRIVYDRKHSSVAEASSSDFDWDSIFAGADWFHITGITPALSESLEKIALEAVKAAKRLGLTVSCDLNFRSKLWSSEKAGAVMPSIMEYTDVCIGNEEDAEKVFGIKSGSTDSDTGKLDKEGYFDTARQMAKKFGLKYVAFSQRASISADENDWSGLLYSSDEDKLYSSEQYRIRLVDRIGGGDAFAAGLIYGLHSGFTPQKTIEFAAASGCLNQTIEGDFCLMDADEVLALAEGDKFGRIKR